VHGGDTGQSFELGVASALRLVASRRAEAGRRVARSCGLIRPSPSYLQMTGRVQAIWCFTVRSPTFLKPRGSEGQLGFEQAPRSPRLPIGACAGRAGRRGVVVENGLWLGQGFDFP
jgi:hypothetical protein